MGPQEIRLRLALLLVYTQLSLENTILPMISPLKVKKRSNDLPLSLNLAKARKQHREKRSLWQRKTSLCTPFVEVAE